MAQKLNRAAMADHADVHDAPPAASESHQVDRTFELPTGLYIATAVCYLAFLGITALAFSHTELVIPMVVLVLLIVAAFGLLGIWSKLAPGSSSTFGIKAKSWAKFQREGIHSLTGHNTAGAATVQVLILPALIVVWGLAVVTIAAIVR